MKNIIITVLFLGITLLGFAQPKDEEAVKAVCMKETQSFINRDADGMIACRANKPYSLMLAAESGNVHRMTAKSKLEDELGIREMVRMMGPSNGETFMNSGYVTHINGMSAFTYYDQVVTTKDGTKTNTHEVRNLEKLDGKWKIFYVGAVKFNPEAK